MLMKLNKGLLSFLSGLGFSGLAFYIAFFTLINNQIYIFAFSIATAFLGSIVIYFMAIAFSFIEIGYKLSNNLAGFIGGILTMIAIAIIILSFNLENLGIVKNLNLIDKIHPIVTFFTAGACTLLYIWPIEKW